MIQRIAMRSPNRGEAKSRSTFSGGRSQRGWVQVLADGDDDLSFNVTQSFQQLGEDLAPPVPAEGSAHAHIDERPSIDRIDPGRETPRRVVSRQPSEMMGGWLDRGIEKIQTGWKGCEYEVLVHQGLYRARR